MNAHSFRRVVVACAVLAVWTLAANYVEAQTRREGRRGELPIPVQPVPVPVQPPPAVAAPVPAASGERIESTRTQGRNEGRLIRGRELIGMTIWGRNQERLGTVKDFIVDYEGDCPTLFFAMTPEISGWSEGYVIVPFDAFQIGYDERQRTDYFVLGVAVDNLRRAPHLEVDRWNSLRDRQFFTEARQFYRRTERTAARPDLDAGRDGRQGGALAPPQTPLPREQGAPRQRQVTPPAENERATPAPARTPSPSGTKPGSQRESDASPQPSPPTHSPGAAPSKPAPGPSKPESTPGKER